MFVNLIYYIILNLIILFLALHFDILNTVCSNAIDIRLPSLKNFGDAVASLDVVGDFGPVPRFVRRLPTVWTGTDGINIPYYGGQTLKRFYLEVLNLAI